MKRIYAILLTIITAVIGARADIHPDAPGIATELEAYFSPGELSGQFFFKVPNTTEAGEALSGNLSYRINVNGTQRATGQAYAGVITSRQFTFTQRGEYTFDITFYNEHGDGRTASLTTGIGYPMPLAPASVSAEATPQGVRLSWTPVTSDVEGNPIEGEVFYRITRYRDETRVADYVSGTEYIDLLDIPTQPVAYTYGVAAIGRNVAGEETISPKVVFGQVTPPWSTNFGSYEAMDIFNTIDYNGDGYQWMYYYGEVYVSSGQNDWLISPAIKMTPSSLYDVSVRLKARSDAWLPQFELCWGTAPTPEAMTHSIIAPTTVPTESYTSFAGTIFSDSDTPIYIGLHNIEAGYGALATDLSISGPMTAEVPGAVTGLVVQSDPSGAMAAHISLYSPTKTINGNDLQSLERVVIERDGVVIHTVESPAMGAFIEHDDTTAEEAREYLYTVYAENAAGRGTATEARVFVGLNVPQTPASARAYETETNGEVTIEWSAVTHYADGRELDPQTVTYNVYTPIGGEDIKILTGLTGTSTTFQAILPGEPQYMFYYCVTAENAAGENLMPAVTEMIPLGEPYEAPYEDSFADLYPSYLYGQGTEEIYTYWDYASDTTYTDEGITTYDHDNGMFVLKAQETGYYAYLFTGKIDITNLERPALTFYVHNNEADADNTIEVLVNDRTGFRTTGTHTLASTGNYGWNRITVPLTDYADGTVQIKLVGTTHSSCRLLMDNMRIVQRYDRDLHLEAADMPDYVKGGNNLIIPLTITNQGLNDNNGYRLHISVNGTETDVLDMNALSSDDSAQYIYTLHRDAIAPEVTSLKFTVDYTSDEYQNDNVLTADIPTLFPTYPTVDDLQALCHDDDWSTVHLQWSTPNMNTDVYDRMTQTFDEMPDWETDDLEGWTILDLDGGEIYGFGSWVEIPGIPASSHQSWWVMNGDYEPYHNHFHPIRSTTAHSGSKYLTQMAVLKDGNEVKCDDWAISPRLTTRAQSVTLWARSFFDTDPETFEFLVSENGASPEDFTLLRTVNRIPDVWTKYSFELPEGSTHFAIRCISRDCFMLMIDDVDFEAAARGTDLTPAGYNIYCDHVRLNAEPIATPAFTITGVEGKDHIYNVTAVYAGRGESQFSNDAKARASALTETADAAMTLHTTPSTLTVSAPAGWQITVVGIDGHTAACFTASGNDSISLAPGVYLVKSPYETVKILIP